MTKLEHEATAAAADESIAERCREAQIKSVLSLPHVTDEGVVRIGDEIKSYILTKPLPRPGGERESFMEVFEGIVQINGANRTYLIQRFNRKGGWTESRILIDGKFFGSVRRGNQPRTFVNTGSFELNGQAHSYKLRETVNPLDEDTVQLERDEIESVMMMAAS